jgi:hypothetical protein
VSKLQALCNNAVDSLAQWNTFYPQIYNTNLLTSMSENLAVSGMNDSLCKVLAFGEAVRRQMEPLATTLAGHYERTPSYAVLRKW